jgi:hypothetical protein
LLFQEHSEAVVFHDTSGHFVDVLKHTDISNSFKYKFLLICVHYSFIKPRVGIHGAYEKHTKLGEESVQDPKAYTSKGDFLGREGLP